MIQNSLSLCLVQQTAPTETKTKKNSAQNSDISSDQNENSFEIFAHVPWIGMREIEQREKQCAQQFHLLRLMIMRHTHTRARVSLSTIQNE